MRSTSWKTSSSSTCAPAPSSDAKQFREGLVSKARTLAVMRSSSEEGSYSRLVDFVSLNSRPRVIKKKRKKHLRSRPEPRVVPHRSWCRESRSDCCNLD